MTNVITFPGKSVELKAEPAGDGSTPLPEIDENNPNAQHVSGNARCLLCKCTWVAVAEVGVSTLQCPNCGFRTGMFNDLVAPAIGTEVLTCDCGCENFWVLKTGYMCYKCGEVTEHDILG